MLPNEVAAAANATIFIAEVASTEHDPQHLNTVTKHYTPLGIEAADLARTVRRKYKLPEKTKGDWDPEQILRVNDKQMLS
ncbi:MAG: hypothetical protein HYS63_09855 [Methylocystis sp.]|nr:hypothetical protein [Methylocystis sp.]